MGLVHHVPTWPQTGLDIGLFGHGQDWPGARLGWIRSGLV